jgi:hypothetical protein
MTSRTGLPNNLHMLILVEVTNCIWNHIQKHIKQIRQDLRIEKIEVSDIYNTMQKEF